MYAMCSTSVFTYPMTMMSQLCHIFYHSFIYLQTPFLQMEQNFAYSYGSCCSFVNGIIFFFPKLIIFIACSFKDSQKIFMQSSSLHTLNMYRYILVHLLFLCMIFQHYFYIPLFFSIKESRSA